MTSRFFLWIPWVLWVSSVSACVVDSGIELVQWLQVTEVEDMEDRVRAIAAHGTLNERLTVVSHLGSRHQGERTDPAAADLVALFLDDENLEVVSKAAHNVGYLGGRRHIARLVVLGGHPDFQVRNLAISGVGMMAGPGDEWLLEFLYPLLADPEVLVRMSAVEAVAQIDSPGSAERLLAAFAVEDHLAVQRTFIVALGRLENPIALPALRAYREKLPEIPPRRFGGGFYRGGPPSRSSMLEATEAAIARVSEKSSSAR